MTAAEIRERIRTMIAEDELWIVRARGLITSDSDCASIERDVAQKQVQVDRMREILAAS